MPHTPPGDIDGLMNNAGRKRYLPVNGKVPKCPEFGYIARVPPVMVKIPFDDEKFLLKVN